MLNKIIIYISVFLKFGPVHFHSKCITVKHQYYSCYYFVVVVFSSFFVVINIIPQMLLMELVLNPEYHILSHSVTQHHILTLKHIEKKIIFILHFYNEISLF